MQAANRTRSIVGAGIALVALAGGGLCLAVDTSWTAGAGTWNWSTGGNWSAGAPTNGQVVDILQNTAGDIDIAYDVTGLTGLNLTLGNTGGGTTTLLVGGGTLTLANGGLHVNAGSVLEQTGGTITSQNGQISGGTFNMSGGTLTNSVEDFYFYKGAVNFSGSANVSITRMVWAGTWGGPVDVTISDNAHVVVNQNFVASGYEWGPGNWGGQSNILQTGGYFQSRFTMYEQTDWEFRGGTMKGYNMVIRGGEFRQTGGTMDNVYDLFIEPLYTSGAGCPFPTTLASTATYSYTGGTASHRGIFIDGGGTFVQAPGLTLTTNGSSGSPGVVLGRDAAYAPERQHVVPATYLLHGGTMDLAGGDMRGLALYSNGLFRGHGTVYVDGGLYNAGKVIADGEGTNNDLTLARCFITQGGPEWVPAGGTDTGNPSGTAGWYAVNKGKLILPPAGDTVYGYWQGNPPVNAGSGQTYNIGESPYSNLGDARFYTDQTIDLVNSAQITFNGAIGGWGSLFGALLATNRDDVAAPPPTVTFISVHDLSTNCTFESFDLTIRYDALAAGFYEDTLALYHYVGGNWLDVTSGLDMTHKWITASDLTSFSQFAVGFIPEPTSLALLALGGLGVLRRRRPEMVSAQE